MGPGPWALDLGPWILALGPWILGPGPLLLGPGTWVLALGSWVLGLGFGVLDLGSLLLELGSWFLGPGPTKQTLGGNSPLSDSERGEFLLTFVESLLPVPGGTTPRREPHTLSLIRRGRVFSSNLRDSGPKLSTRGPLGGQHSDPFRSANKIPRRISVCETIFQCIFCIF